MIDLANLSQPSQTVVSNYLLHGVYLAVPTHVVISMLAYANRKGCHAGRSPSLSLC
jgi:hypothetical protein